MTEASKTKIILLLSCLTILLSSSLLFIVQPITTKLFLPLFGGSPAVWNTSMMFYQLALLAGYYFSDRLVRLSDRTEIVIYLLLLIIALFTLPIGLPSSWAPNWRENVSLNLIHGLFLCIGVPFLILTTASPLIQRWFSYSTHKSAKDPYFLYAISNAGSLIALIGYPILIEPYSSIESQLNIWSSSFVVYCVCILILRLFVTKGERSYSSEEKHKLTRSEKFKWIILAFIPSSLSLGVTQHLTTDVAAFPLLWVLPLSIYLFSFVVAFSKIGQSLSKLFSFLFPIGVIIPAVLISTELKSYIITQIILHLVSLLIICISLHLRLSELRPKVENLTSYYLYLSIGGAFGGIFNSLVAPIVFNGIYEYSLILVMACVFAGPLNSYTSKTPKISDILPSKDDFISAILAVSLLIVAAPISYEFFRNVKAGELSSFQLIQIISVAILCLLSCNNKKRLSLIVFCITIYPQLGILSDRITLFIDRTFFGVHRVQLKQKKDGPWIELWHGSTLHGIQSANPEKASIATTYYAATSPIGKVLLSQKMLESEQEIGIIGLGSGTTAIYGQPNWSITYFEIDPTVIEIAKNAQFFTFLRQSKAKIRFGLGDARIKIANIEDRFFNLIVVDAFSSDAIPIHLITEEAIRLYISKLNENGLLLFHLTNRYLDLNPVISQIAHEVKLDGVICEDFMINQIQESEGKFGSKWAILSRNYKNIEDYKINLEDCSNLPPRTEMRVWRDSFSNVVSVVR